MNARIRTWLRPAFVLFLVAAAAMFPAILRGPYLSDSGVLDHVQTTQFADALRTGILYPRWMPDSFEGYGDATYYFYPPTTFYLSAALQILGLSTVQAVNGAFLVLLWASGVTMYLWLRPRARRPLLWACIYVVAPYHLTDAYARQALAETGSFVWLPIIALGLVERRWRLFAASYAGLICTHLPVSLLTSVSLIPALGLANARGWRDLASVAIAGALGLCTAAIYLLPALALQRHVATDLLYFPFYRPESWSILHPAPNIIRGLLIPWAYYVAGLAIALLNGFRQRPTWTLLAWLCGLAALGVLPIWDLPLIWKVQFPWRFMGIVEFAACTALALTPAPRLIFAAAAAAVAAPGIIQCFSHNLTIYRQAYDVQAFRERRGNPEYLPAKMDVTGITSGQRVPRLARFGGEPRSDRVLVRAPRQVVLRTFYFPSWTVTQSGRNIPVEPFGAGQLVSFYADRPGAYRVRLRSLPVEWAGLALSMVGVGALALGGRRRRDESTIAEALFGSPASEPGGGPRN